MFYPAGLDIRADRFKLKGFVVPGRPAEPGRKLGNDEEDISLLEVAVSEALRPQQFRPAHLEPHGVYAVVDDTCLVGFRVTGNYR